MKKVFIIAEAGINHNGSVSRAKKMIDIAAECGADAIKFQTFKAENVISKLAPKAEYQKKNTSAGEAHIDMVKKYELNYQQHETLINICRRKNIIFISSPFDLQSINMLNKLDLKIFKIPSGEITNLPYLRLLGSLNRNIILSTGMSTMVEIRKALDVLIAAGTKSANITILHCNTEYPTPLEDVNLQAMCAIKKVFNLKVGYSDHTLGIEIPIAAVALGASVIEKHFTLDQNLTGPDHKASLDPIELKQMVNSIRDIERSMGDGIKRPSQSESKNLHVVRKSIIAKKEIIKGERFTIENLTVKRPGSGISPMRWDRVLGKISKKSFKVDDLIEI